MHNGCVCVCVCVCVCARGSKIRAQRRNDRLNYLEKSKRGLLYNAQWVSLQIIFCVKTYDIRVEDYGIISLLSLCSRPLISIRWHLSRLRTMQCPSRIRIALHRRLSISKISICCRFCTIIFCVKGMNLDSRLRYSLLRLFFFFSLRFSFLAR